MVWSLDFGFFLHFRLRAFRSAMELYHQFDSSQMAFNPAIPTPKKVDLNKEIKGRHFWADTSVEQRCSQAMSQTLIGNGFIDFAADYRNGIRTNFQPKPN